MFYSPLKNKLYQTIWLVVFISNLGTWIHTVVTSILMTHLTKSPLVIALVQVSAMLPILLFSISAGIIADLCERKFLIITAQIFMCFIAFLMALLSYWDIMTPGLLISMTLLLNLGLTFNQPAWQAMASTLVPQNEIKQAVVLNNLSFNLSRCIGPAIAGYFYVLVGPQWLFLCNALSFLGVIYIFKRQISFNKNDFLFCSKKQFYHGFKESFLFFNQFPLLKFLSLKSSLYFFFSSSLWTLLPFLIITKNQMTPEQLGILTTCSGIGTIANAYFIYVLRKVFNDSQLTTFSLLLSGIAIFGMAVSELQSKNSKILLFYWSVLKLDDTKRCYLAI